MAGDFSRFVKEDLIKELTKSALWKERLKVDCKAGEVFLALRKDAINFYYKGGKFLTFDSNGYSTSVKNASVIVSKGGDVREKQLGESVLIKSFSEGYDRIKENCTSFACPQKRAASVLWHNCSYLSKEPSVILDLDISLSEGGKDTVDVLLYNKSKQILRLVEVKLFSNKDLFNPATPKEAKLLQSYKELVKANKKSILSEYGKYINSLNMVFKSHLKTPAELDEKVALTVFGFDGAQINDKRYTNLLKKNPAYKDIPIYCKGDAAAPDFLARNIFKKTCS
jgi:hypothetical protein